jgi:peptidoglycan biosynthesis protein MviN/MurJ (putative lipid II flippase)
LILRLNEMLRRPGVRALIGTALGGAPGFLLPFAIASRLGVGRITDAYVYGLAVGGFGLALCISTIEQNVLPVAQAYTRGGRRSLLGFARKTALQGFLGVTIADLPVVAVGLLLLTDRHGWPPWQRHLGITIILILVVLVAVAGANSALAGCLYALNDFLLPTATQSFRSIAPAVGLVFVGRGRTAAELLAILVVAGELCRTPVLAVRLARLSRGLRSTDKVRPVTSVWRTALPAGLGILAIAANPIIDRTVAARYGPGSVTMLDLGEKIFFIPVTIVGASIVLVAGARWAALALNDASALAHDFRRTLRRGVVLACVLAPAIAGATYLGFAVLGPTIGGVPSKNVRDIVLFFLAGLPFATVALLAARLLTSTRNTRLLPALAAQAVVVNLTGDLIGGHFLGTRGIALSSAVVWGINALLLLLVARRVLARNAGPVLHLGADLPYRRGQPRIN